MSKNNKDNLGKFDAKSDKGIFLGYSTTSKNFIAFNKRTIVVEESIHVILDEYMNQKYKGNKNDNEIEMKNASGQLDINSTLVPSLINEEQHYHTS